MKIVYGEKSLETNLDFIAKALGNKGNTSREVIRNYFLNDFFKDHCNTYSVTGSGKRPMMHWKKHWQMHWRMQIIMADEESLWLKRVRNLVFPIPVLSE